MKLAGQEAMERETALRDEIFDVRRRCAAQLKSAADFLDALANRLDGWAESSRKGGWSTHQVEANVATANDCRRQAAQLRSTTV
jgi:hypothetical protein